MDVIVSFEEGIIGPKSGNYKTPPKFPPTKPTLIYLDHYKTN